jgi:hypothetical protein
MQFLGFSSYGFLLLNEKEIIITTSLLPVRNPIFGAKLMMIGLLL